VVEDFSGDNKWLMWLIPLIIAAAALWYYLGHKQSAAVTSATEPTASAVAAAPAVVIDNIDVGKTLDASMTTLVKTLGGVTDAASAQAALGTLKETTAAIGQAAGLAASFTPEQRGIIAKLVDSGLPALKHSASRAEALPGAGNVLKPVIDPAIAQLETLIKR
jgi:single-stranded DNA-specific DHH superfamily exonuclease